MVDDQRRILDKSTAGSILITLEHALFQETGWTTVVVENVSVADALTLRYSLVQDGLVIDQDFAWAYRQSEYDGFTMNRPAHAAFAFCDPAMASFYSLKWK